MNQTQTAGTGKLLQSSIHTLKEIESMATVEEERGRGVSPLDQTVMTQEHIRAKETEMTDLRGKTVAAETMDVVMGDEGEEEREELEEMTLPLDTQGKESHTNNHSQRENPRKVKVSCLVLF